MRSDISKHLDVIHHTADRLHDMHIRLHNTSPGTTAEACALEMIHSLYIQLDCAVRLLHEQLPPWLGKFDYFLTAPDDEIYDTIRF